MDADIAKKTGQANSERVAAYKLNEIKLNGDDGKFYLREVLSEKDANGKYRVRDMGNELAGVILKMRWRLSRYQEAPASSYQTSEYDDKFKDTVIEFSTKEKGLAADLKAKLKLGSQRVLYVFLPKEQEIVRVIVKASALGSELNPGKENGLFKYIDEHNIVGTGVHEYITNFKSVFRKDAQGNKRKDYYAMIFVGGRALSDTEKEKVLTMIDEVHEKVGVKKFAEAYNALDEINEEEEEYPVEGVNPDDIPF